MQPPLELGGPVPGIDGVRVGIDEARRDAAVAAVDLAARGGASRQVAAAASPRDALALDRDRAVFYEAVRGGAIHGRDARPRQEQIPH